MNFIVICKLWDTRTKTVWIRGVTDFNAAVEKAKALPEEMLPAIEPKQSYANASAKEQHEKRMHARHMENGCLVREVLELKTWNLD